MKVQNQTDTAMQPELFVDILDENETLLWMDKPNRRVWMYAGYISLGIGLLWGLPWLALLFGMPSPPSGRMLERMSFAIFIGAFYGFPCYGSLFYLYWLHCAKEKTVYACSEKRILIKRGGFGISYTTILYGDIRYVTAKVGWFENRIGTGSLWLETGAWQPWFFGLDNWNPKRIVGIEKPYEVAKIINAQIQAAGK